MKIILSLLLIAAGVSHFLKTAAYMKAMPPSLPWPEPLVLMSGLAAILLGFLLIPDRTARLGGWATIAFLIAVFPANLQSLERARIADRILARAQAKMSRSHGGLK